MVTSPPVASPDILWKQYELQVGLYKDYLKLLLQFNAYYYAATGALVAYYFSHLQTPLMRCSLAFPVLMSVGFSILFFYGASQIQVVRMELFEIRDRLGLGTAPEYKVLTIFLLLSAALMLIVAVSLISLMWINPALK
ncbi:MAG TPA: hypothetical protein VN881_11350 [Candidatus Acidoferrales bacterium]|nr:hypothetical protein [Candidatus Acidoferrales bacterium]